MQSSKTIPRKQVFDIDNIDNTSDLDKPISNATQIALNLKQDTLNATNLATLNNGLSTDDTITDASVFNYTKGSSQVKTTWGNIKSFFQSVLVSGTNIKTINGTSILGSGDLVVSGGSGGVNVLRGSVNQITGTPNEGVATNASAGGNWVLPVVNVTKSGGLITGPSPLQSERVATTSTIKSISFKYFQEDGSGGIIFRFYAFKINNNSNVIYDCRLLFQKTVSANLYTHVNQTFLPIDILDVNLIEGEQICMTVQLASATAARAIAFNLLIRY